MRSRVGRKPVVQSQNLVVKLTHTVELTNCHVTRQMSASRKFYLYLPIRFVECFEILYYT
jgi:hypothetical protein